MNSTTIQKKHGRIVAVYWQDYGRAFGDRRAIIVL